MGDGEAAIVAARALSFVSAISLFEKCSTRAWEGILYSLPSKGHLIFTLESEALSPSV